LVENAGTLAFVDIEATGLRADYDSTLVVSIKPYGGDPYSFSIKQPGNDQKVVKDAKASLENYDAWVTYYGKGFDIPFLNTRLLKWGQSPIEKRPHIDMYYSLKANILTSRRSQGHLASWLGLPEQKMGVSADVWASIVGNVKKHMPEMVSRCESDILSLEDMYDRTKHVIREIKR
jgi:uncharacterized protein YprB with RNaseH-like and TPR domain